ncbi:hypothetical protein GCM10009733_011910 [Nonomuraea maheshkhaliensis]|uniref:Alpha/beta hydrolase n=1 Tax=Nonomuraea maheshkhaliensis TaxID=419590 RepID=A0ABP4QTH8_9ACTN
MVAGSLRVPFSPALEPGRVTEGAEVVARVLAVAGWVLAAAIAAAAVRMLHRVPKVAGHCWWRRSFSRSRWRSSRLTRLARQAEGILVIEGARHYEMYDEPEYIAQAVGRLRTFFGKHLA